MKRLVSLLLTMTFVVTALCGCGVTEVRASGIFGEILSWGDFSIELNAWSETSLEAIEKSEALSKYDWDEDILTALSRGAINLKAEWFNKEGRLTLNGEITFGDTEKQGSADKKVPEFYVELKDIHITSNGLLVSIETLQSVYDAVSRCHEDSLYAMTEDELATLRYILETTQNAKSTHAVIPFYGVEINEFYAIKEFSFAFADVVIGFIEEAYKDYALKGLIVEDKHITLAYTMDSFFTDLTNFIEYNATNYEKQIRSKRGLLCDNLEKRLRPIVEKYPEVFVYVEDYIEPHWEGKDIPCNDVIEPVLDFTQEVNCIDVGGCVIDPDDIESDGCAVRPVEEQITSFMDDIRYEVNDIFEYTYNYDFERELEGLKSEEAEAFKADFKGSVFNIDFRDLGNNEYSVQSDFILHHDNYDIAHITIDECTISNKVNRVVISNTYTEFDTTSEEFKTALNEFKKNNGIDMQEDYTSVFVTWKSTDENPTTASYSVQHGRTPATTELAVTLHNIDGRIYLPMRRVCEDLGYDVHWDDIEKTASVLVAHKDPEVDAIGFIDMTGIIIDGSTYIKVRDFEKLDLVVDYEEFGTTSDDRPLCSATITKTPTSR